MNDNQGTINVFGTRQFNSFLYFFFTIVWVLVFDFELKFLDAENSKTLIPSVRMAIFEKIILQ